VLSASACLRAAVLLGAIALSLLVAFATGGFWRKAEWDLLQPVVKYTGDGLAIFEVRAAHVTPCLIVLAARPPDAQPCPMRSSSN
jgi:hypothetical protein